MMRSRIQIGLAALTIAALFGASHWVYAQQGPAGSGFGRGHNVSGLPRLQQLARQLDLTEAQKAEIQGLLGGARTQMNALGNDTSLTREQRMDQVQRIGQQTRDQIRSVLTPDQQLRADELRQQAEQRFGAQREKMQGQMLERLTSQLNLSESQRSTIELYQNDQKTQLDILKDNSSLTASEKFEQMQFVRQQTQEKIRATLTADQQAQLDQLRGQRENRRGERPRRGPRSGPRGGGVQNQGFNL